MSVELQAIIDNLRTEVATLQYELKQLREELQAQRRITSPYQPIGPGITETPWNIPKPYTPKSSPSHPEFKKSCPKCGIKLEGVMGYSCPDSECPVFSQATC